MVNETTATMELDYLIAEAAFIKTDAAIMGRELRPSERRIIEFVDNMTATHDVEIKVTSWEDEHAKLVDIVARVIAIKEDAAMMKRELTEQEREFIEMVNRAAAVYDEEKEIPTGWLCPRCGAVNAPDMKRCDCEPSIEDNRRGTLGPSETK